MQYHEIPFSLPILTALGHLRERARPFGIRFRPSFAVHLDRTNVYETLHTGLGRQVKGCIPIDGAIPRQERFRAVVQQVC